MPDLKDLELPDLDALDEAIPGFSDLDMPDLDGLSDGLGDFDFSGISPDDLSNITADDLEALSDLDLSDLPFDFDNIPIPEKDAFTKIAVPENQYLEIYDDHINIEGKIAVMRVPYYEERLKDLDSFDGFVARWYIPGESLYFSKSNTTAIITVMILDTAKEI